MNPVEKTGKTENGKTQEGNVAMNLAEYIFHKVNYSETKPVTYCEGEYYSRGDYRDAADDLTAFFEENGFRKNTSAILLMGDSPVTSAIFLACIRFGIVPVIISTLTMPHVLEQVIRTADASYVFSDRPSPLTEIHDQVTVVHASGKSRAGALKLFIENADFVPPQRFVDAEESAYFLMTSGSTGMPKIVMHSHPAFVDTNQNYAVDMLHITEEDVIYSNSKMCFGYGLANCLLFPVLTGAMAYLSDEEFDPAGTFRTIHELHPTVFFAVPSAYRMIMEYLDRHPEERESLEGIRLFVSAGEPLNKKTAESWYQKTGRFLTNNMGTSEASAILYDDGNEAKFGSAGRPVNGTEIRLLNEEGEDADTGILFFTSKGNSIGYRNNPEEMAAKFHDGWFRTGDVFHRDEDGYYWALGREDNMLKYHGMWVSPMEVEKHMQEFPGVSQAAVFKMTIHSGDLLASALVVNDLFEGIDPLREYLMSRMEAYKCPEKMMIFDRMPLNNNGKTDFPTIRQRILEESEGAQESL